MVIAAAQRVLRPYTLDVKDVAWFAVYQVGQRVTDRFDDVPAEQARSRLPHVFIAGDACHTHSAKAGQGMDVSMQDTFNLGWKLVSVLEGRAGPELLRTYNVERHAIAQRLIDFDKEWSKIMASPPKDPKRPELGGVDPAELEAYFVKSGRYTAGVATRYPPETVLTASSTHQDLAKGFTIGMRFQSAPVVRLADAKPMQLGHAARVDAAWRIYAFADANAERLRALADFLAKRPVRGKTGYSLPRANPRASLMQSVGGADVEIVYGRPAVNGRKVWGGLVPNGRVWRAGANEATTFTFNREVRIEGRALPAGTYTFFAIPGEMEWTMILNRVPRQWGAVDYNPSFDALRFDVKPIETPFEEYLRYAIQPEGSSAAVVTLAWERRAVTFRIDAQP